MGEFETKDSGQRINLANGMVRDNRNGKPDYTLILKGPLHKRWAELLTRAAPKYGKHNWCKALESTDTAAREETKARFQESAIGHMMQWLAGERDEDHAAAVIFNMNGYEAMLETDAAHVPHDPAEPVDHGPFLRAGCAGCDAGACDAMLDAMYPADDARMRAVDASLRERKLL